MSDRFVYDEDGDLSITFPERDADGNVVRKEPEGSARTAELRKIEKQMRDITVRKVAEPTAGEGEKEFISRCIETEVKAGYPQDQAAAMCYRKWRERKNG